MGDLSGGEPQALVQRSDLTLGDALVRPSQLTVEGPLGPRRTEPRVVQVLMA